MATAYNEESFRHMLDRLGMEISDNQHKIDQNKDLIITKRAQVVSLRI